VKLVVSEFVTLDGVMEAPGGEPGHPHSGWAGAFMGPQEVHFKLGEVLEAEAHLLGRVTYESFAGAWPQREGPMADKINSMPKYVVSTTLRELEWTNCTLIGGNVVEEIQKLRQRDGGPLLVAGSRTLLHTLMANDLVDEYRFMVFPVAVGSGLRLFPETPEKTELELTGTQTFDSGAVVNTYVPTR
jgi:dihydrofolate reductase